MLKTTFDNNKKTTSKEVSSKPVVLKLFFAYHSCVLLISRVPLL